MAVSEKDSPVGVRGREVKFDKPYVLERMLVHDYRYLMRIVNFLLDLPEEYRTPRLETALEQAIGHAKRSVEAIENKAGNPVDSLVEAVSVLEPVLSSMSPKAEAIMVENGYNPSRDKLLAVGIPGSRVKLAKRLYEQRGIDPDFPMRIPPDGLDLLIWAL